MNNKQEKEKIKKEIEYIKEQIELEKSFNPNKGTISFLQYQLWCEREKLKKLEEEE